MPLSNYTSNNLKGIVVKSNNFEIDSFDNKILRIKPPEGTILTNISNPKNSSWRIVEDWLNIITLNCGSNDCGDFPEEGIMVVSPGTDQENYVEYRRGTKYNEFKLKFNFRNKTHKFYGDKTAQNFIDNYGVNTVVKYKYLVDDFYKDKNLSLYRYNGTSNMNNISSNLSLLNNNVIIRGSLDPGNYTINNISKISRPDSFVINNTILDSNISGDTIIDNDVNYSITVMDLDVTNLRDIFTFTGEGRNRKITKTITIDTSNVDNKFTIQINDFFNIVLHANGKKIYLSNPLYKNNLSIKLTEISGNQYTFKLQESIMWINRLKFQL